MVEQCYIWSQNLYCGTGTCWLWLQQIWSTVTSSFVIFMFVPSMLTLVATLYEASLKLSLPTEWIIINNVTIVISYSLIVINGSFCEWNNITTYWYIAKFTTTIEFGLRKYQYIAHCNCNSYIWYCNACCLNVVSIQSV